MVDVKINTYEEFLEKKKHLIHIQNGLQELSNYAAENGIAMTAVVMARLSREVGDALELAEKIILQNEAKQPPKVAA